MWMKWVGFPMMVCLGIVPFATLDARRRISYPRMMLGSARSMSWSYPLNWLRPWKVRHSRWRLWLTGERWRP